MSQIMKIVRAENNRDKNTFVWDEHLHECERGETSFVPYRAFSSSLLHDFSSVLNEGIVFECVLHDYNSSLDGVTARWWAHVKKVCGLRVLAQYVESPTTFWMNMLSDDVHAMTDAYQKDPRQTTILYVPPPPLDKECIERTKRETYRNELDGKQLVSMLFEEKRAILWNSPLRVGQRLELLNYAKSTEFRVGRIREICGRRLKVLVSKDDYPGILPGAKKDRQALHPGAEFWVDQESFMLFPVGFAAFNGYRLQAKEDYKYHTMEIADAMSNGAPLPYRPEDVTFDVLYREPVKDEDWCKVKVGQKFEMIDPLSQQSKSLHVASVLAIYETPGYILIGPDGPNQAAESFPIHINNVYMFPVGFAEENGLTLTPPDDYKGDFKWEKYLEDEGAQPLPLNLFKSKVDKERLDMLKVGMRLEAVDMAENHLICPATIKSIHGRVVNVNFDGWGEEFDQLYDLDSHNILPAGWCELHGYPLQHPKTP